MRRRLRKGTKVRPGQDKEEGDEKRVEKENTHEIIRHIEEEKKRMKAHVTTREGKGEGDDE